MLLNIYIPDKKVEKIPNVIEDKKSSNVQEIHSTIERNQNTNEKKNIKENKNKYKYVDLKKYSLKNDTIESLIRKEENDKEKEFIEVYTEGIGDNKNDIKESVGTSKLFSDYDNKIKELIFSNKNNSKKRDITKIQKTENNGSKKRLIDKDNIISILKESNEIYKKSINTNPIIEQNKKKIIEKNNKHIKPGEHFETIVSKEVNSFDDLIEYLGEKICYTLKELKFQNPTKIQSIVIPTMYNTNKDIFIKSETGSGKTLAYLLPIIYNIATNIRIDKSVNTNEKINTNNLKTRSIGTQALIVVPTRELALQIQYVCDKIIHKCYFWLLYTTLIGGEKKKSEKTRLRKGIHIVIGTPGRIVDHITNTASWSLRYLRWFVLDEADRLLDFGFSNDIQTIYENIDPLRTKNVIDTVCRCIFVSATIGGSSDNVIDRRDFNSMRQFVKSISKNIEFIGFTDDEKDFFLRNIDIEENTDTTTTTTITTIDSSNNNLPKLNTPQSLQQFYCCLSSRHKVVALASFLRLQIELSKNNQHNCKIIVFLSTIASVEIIYELLTRIDNWPDSSSIPLLQTTIQKLHGDIEQKIRRQVYDKFIKLNDGILLCTDVVARGLDLPCVDWIVQYDPPDDIEDYIHRVGRTARVGNIGKSLIFLLNTEQEYVHILSSRNLKLQEITIIYILSGLHINCTLQIRAIQQSTQLTAGIILQKKFEQIVKNYTELYILAQEAYINYLRSYSRYPRYLKHIFHVKRLHYGEVAHSFGLTEPPSSVTRRAQSIHSKSQKLRPNTILRPPTINNSLKQEKKKKKKDVSLFSLSKARDTIEKYSEFQ